MAPRRERTFLVESYVPRLDERESKAISARIRTAVAELGDEGVRLRWLHSVALVGEETYLWLLVTTDADRVAQASKRAGVRFDHVAEVVLIDPADA